MRTLEHRFGRRAPLPLRRPPARRSARRLLASALLLAALFAPAERSDAVTTFTPSGFIEEVVASGLPWATGIAFAPDGRMFIALKHGVVRVYQNGALLPTPFVDISSHTANSNDRGLLGIVVHPDFPATPYVYLLYTWNPPGVPTTGFGGRVSRLIRIEADPAQGFNVATAGSSQPQTVEGGPGHVIVVGKNSTAANIGSTTDGRNKSLASCMVGLTMAGAPTEDCLPSDEDSHSIGTVLFGNDGSLFLSSGDGANYSEVDHRALRSQNLDSLAGKILRIDPVTGLGLPDNPFYDPLCPQCNRSKVYSRGLRNPFRFTVHPVTNEPYIGDVGWNTWEEVNTGKGANFGWPCYEGGTVSGAESGNTTSQQQGSYATNPTTISTCGTLYGQGLGAVRAPVFTYSHGTDGTGSSGGASVNGGTFYTGNVYPAAYQNALFILDYNRRWIRYLTFNQQGTATVHNFGKESANGMVQVLSGPDSNLYVVVLNATGSEVRRIRYIAGGNTPPTAVVDATPRIGIAPLPVTFSSLGSFDPDNQPLSYSWTFGDGGTSTALHPTHTYTAPGTYTARLTLTEQTAPFASRTAEVLITIGSEPPLATITQPANGTTYWIGDTITYAGVGSIGGTPIDPSLLSWSVRLHHNEHVHVSALPSGATGSLPIIEHGDDTYHELCLTVSVPPGFADVRCIDLLPVTTTTTLTTVPPGLLMNYEDEGLTLASPLLVEPVVGSQQTVSVPLVQGGLTFDRWSDGVQSNSHPFTVGTTPQTYTAEYVNRLPVAVASAGPLSGNAPHTVSFVGSGSSDPEGTPLTYAWNFGDGATSTQADVVHEFAASGTYGVTLVVTDQRGGIASQQLSIVVAPASPLCGNGQLDAGEACDGSSCCTLGCQFAPVGVSCQGANVCEVGVCAAGGVCQTTSGCGANQSCNVQTGVCEQGSGVSVWPNTTVPTQFQGADTPFELGVKFRSTTAGVVTGVRFYKGPGNTGTHVGNLWAQNGDRLATAVFTNETASGWQQVTFPTPVPIAANTVYTASYHCPNGFYAREPFFFAGVGVDAPPLRLLASGEEGGNGVFAASSVSAFPNQSYQSSNYWVDVVFQATPTVLQSIAVTSSGPTLELGNTRQFTATGSYQGGATLDLTNQVVWSSTSPQAATIAASGLATAVGLGQTTITATSGAVSGSAPLTVVAAGALTFDTTTLRSVARSTPYSYALQAHGGASPYTWSITSGTLPSGITLNTGTGVLSGTTTAALGTRSLTFRVSDGQQAVTRNLTLAIVENDVVAENELPGAPASQWDVVGAGDASIQGFATAISVDQGASVAFKVNTDSTNYRLDIYRLGYYGGLGARLVATVQPSASLPQVQPPCIGDPATGLVDCGNWAVSASWTVPATATSGVYIAKLVREDPEDGRASHIPFVVRDDDGLADILLQTSDTTWQAYNTYGGNSLYMGAPAGRAYKVSYNRPITTRCCMFPNGSTPSNLFNSEYPLIRWLERNGYDVSYASGVDADRAGAEMLEHRIYMTAGHDEYWSGAQRTNVEAARAAGVNLVFLAGNLGFWKTRFEPSIDGTATARRTLVSYKETHADAKIDPLPGVWTGTWRDDRFGPHDGGRPENSLNGSIFVANGVRNDTPLVPEVFGKMRLWRNTSVATLTAGQTAVLPTGVLGFEWDADLDNGFRPPGLVRMSETTVSGVQVVNDWDYGSSFADGTATHHLTLYRHASGALVFGAGMTQWSWGLDSTHDRAGTPSDPRIQQATVNLLADMQVQPARLQAGLVAATASTDASPPTVQITAPANGATVTGATVTIAGTAADSGGRVGGVEVSTDGGTTWHPATGLENWTYVWTPAGPGPATLRARAVDDSANLSPPTAAISVTYALPQLLSIAVTPASVTIPQGQTQQFTATGTYLGGTTANLTSQVTWASTAPAIATISAAGLATTLTQGPTTITATLGAVSGNALLTVAPPGALVVTTTTLPHGVRGFSYTGALAASGGVPPYTWSITSGALPAGLTLSPTTGQITGTPTALGTSNFTVRASAGAQTAQQALSILVVPPSSVSVWSPTTVPTSFYVADAPVELGVKFRSDIAGAITGVRFYKGPGNTGTHVGNLWTAAGQLLATAVFTNETATGWQQVTFSTPVEIAANTVYIASYHCPSGFYATDHFYFEDAGVDAPPLHLLADGEAGGNSVYSYGATSVFPTSTYRSTNYWVDVVFNATPQLQSITVAPAAATLDVGDTVQLSATGTYVGGYTENLTSQVTWASAQPAIATVSATGLATAVARQATSISATLGAISGSTMLTVVTECSNGVDDDGDGRTDHPSDPGCTSLDDLSERSPLLPCDDGADNDGDGRIDHPSDPGCTAPADSSEREPTLACDDGIDNDEDGRADFDPATLANPLAGTGDRGCGGPAWPLENPACEDGGDNDGDGFRDYDGGQSVLGLCTGLPGGCPAGVSDPEGDGVANPDPECVGHPSLQRENPVSCGLGTELMLLLPLLRIWRRRVGREARSSL